MATTTDRYVSAAIDELEAGPTIAPGQPDDGRVRMDVRRHFGIAAFGINAYRGSNSLIREHDEAGAFSSNQEELYVVVNGDATFTVDGEEIDAPAGTLVFVRPEAKRSAAAKDGEATVLAIGGTPGKAYDPPPVEAAEAFVAYNQGDFETAVAKQLVVLEHRPKDVLQLFNAACFEARLGKAEAAIEHLQQAVEGDDRVKELARTDEDLDSIREDPRFDVLTK